MITRDSPIPKMTLSEIFGSFDLRNYWNFCLLSYSSKLLCIIYKYAYIHTYIQMNE